MYKIGICLSMAVALSACSGGSSDTSGGATTGTSDQTTTGATTGSTAGDTGGSTTGITTGSSTVGAAQYGSVNVYNDGELFFDANFSSIPQQISFANLQSEVQFRPTTDECEITNLNDQGNIPTGSNDNLILGQTISSISAGEVLTVSSATGSYTEILKQQQGAFVFYESDEDAELGAPFPTNLTVSIPGEQFPAFTSVALPELAPLQMSSPSVTDRITASTTFSWTPSTDPNSYIEISASTIIDDAFITIDCNILDDGSFSFSPAFQSQMGAFSGAGRISRETFSFVQQGNAVVHVSMTVDRTN